MDKDLLQSMVLTSLRSPKEAAQQVINLGLKRDALWTALALAAVINTFLVLVIIQSSGSTMPLPSYFSQPLALFIIIAGLTVVYVHAMYWAGMMIGGQGTLTGVLAIVVWFQILRALAQMVILVLSIILPSIGALMSMVVTLWGIWIFLNFLTAALQLKTALHAIAVLMVAFVGLVVGLGLLLGLIGGLSQGVAN